MKSKILSIQTQQTNENWQRLLSRLGHFHPNSISLCRSSLYFRNVRTMANYKQKVGFWISTTGISPCSLVRVCRCFFDDAEKVLGSSVTVTQRFYYSAYLVLGCYSQFSLLDVSAFPLLTAVAVKQSSGIDVCWRNQNNVSNNKMVFSADDRVLIKLLRQEKEYSAKSLSRNFPASRGRCQD